MALDAEDDVPTRRHRLMTLLTGAPDTATVEFDADGYTRTAEGQLVLWRTTEGGLRDVVASFDADADAVLGDPDRVSA